MPSFAEWVLLQQNAPQYYWLATAGAIAHPTTRRYGLRMASYGIRASANVAIASSRALLGTTLVRGGTMTGGSAVGSVAAGYVLGAVVGTGISYAIWGDDGASDAIDLYTGRVSARDYFTTVGRGISTLF